MTKAELKECLKADIERYPGDWNFFWRWIKWDEDYRVLKVLYHLRCTAYYKSNNQGFNKLLYYWHYWNLSKYRTKSNININTEDFGPGLYIVHPGFRRIATYIRCGANCTILPMVLMGKKSPGIEGKIEIGDNCYISTGVTILGPVKIGNNVTLGAGAVITHDIPDNAVVGGIPAKILKFKELL